MFILNVPLWQQIFGELVGTMLLVLLGNGVCFATNHKKMFANQSGRWILIALGWAIAIFIGAFVSSAMGGPGHLNPAVSIYSAINAKNADALAFIPMQFLGAFIGQFILYFMNWKFIKDESAEITANSATRGASCTNPVYNGKNGIVTNLSYEFIGTSILVVMIMIVGSSKLMAGMASNPLTIFIVSTTILGIAISLGSVTGFALNPARDLAPRLAYQVLKSTTKLNLVDANWSYSWIPVVAPLAAGCIFGCVSLAI